MSAQEQKMSRRWTFRLSATLLILISCLECAADEPQAPSAASAPISLDTPSPLLVENSVSGLTMEQNAAGEWHADFDYFYTGNPKPAMIRVKLYEMAGGPAPYSDVPSGLNNPDVGLHHVSVPMNHPFFQGTTRQVVVIMIGAQPSAPILARTQVDQVIDWPDPRSYAMSQQMSRNTPEKNLAWAVQMIDTNYVEQSKEARRILEYLINQNPQLDAAYIELARVAMKTMREEGLHQAEDFLLSALQIRPDNANAKILLGYVYTHQKRYAKAEALFADAEKSNPRNLWLWANWGELYAEQGKMDQAAVKYREAISRPMTHDTYDRAREDAYTNLIKIVEKRKDIDGLEALYKQRLAEFGPGSCFSADYAKFLLQQRGNTQDAIDLAHAALARNCEDSDARQILGLAQYVKWAQTTGPERIESLNQARIYLPGGPMPLYLLATSDRTVPADRQLIASGEQIDQIDNEKLTALGYALKNDDLPAAKRLLALGARPDAPIGFDNMPAALIPVVEGDVESTRMMQRFGVDYSKIRFHGQTAFDMARASGNNVMMEVLGHKDTAL